MTGILDMHRSVTVAVTTAAFAATFLVAPSAEARAPHPCAHPTIRGDSQGNLIVGAHTGPPDVIDARGGNDRVNARGGDDVVCAGGGNDTVAGGEGVDTISGGAGNDRLAGQAGADTLVGGGGDDYINGGEVATGTPEDDVCIGGRGVDTFINCEVVKQD